MMIARDFVRMVRNACLTFAPLISFVFVLFIASFTLGVMCALKVGGGWVSHVFTIFSLLG